MLVVFLGNTAVATVEQQRCLLDADGDIDKRCLAIADAVLEGVLHESDEHQRRYLLVGELAGHIDRDLHLIGIAQLHQLDVILQESNLTIERHDLFVAFVEHEAHHLRQFEDGLLRLLRVNIHQRVDIVQRVHQEVGIDLVFQILQLLFQVLFLQLLQPFAVATLLEVEFDADIHAHHQQEDDDGDDVTLSREERWMLVASVILEARLPAWAVIVWLINSDAGRVCGFHFFEGLHRGLAESFIVGQGRSVCVIPQFVLSALFHHLMAESAVILEVRTVVALIDLEDADDHDAHPCIDPLTLTIDKYRRQQVVVDEEYHEERNVLTPHHHHLAPVETDVFVIGRSDA